MWVNLGRLGPAQSDDCLSLDPPHDETCGLDLLKGFGHFKFKGGYIWANTHTKRERKKKRIC